MNMLSMDRAGIKRVVSGIVDPDPRVASKGLQFLRSQGLEVLSGVEEEACLMMNVPFIYRVLYNRPYLISWQHMGTNSSSLEYMSSRLPQLIERYAPEIDMLWIDSATVIKLLNNGRLRSWLQALPIHIDLMIIQSSSSDESLKISLTAQLIEEIDLDLERSIEPWTLRRKLFYSSGDRYECISNSSLSLAVNQEHLCVDGLLEYCRQRGSNAIFSTIASSASWNQISVSKKKSIDIASLAQKIITSYDRDGDKVDIDVRWRASSSDYQRSIREQHK
jgi:hypothetical protein